MSFGLWARMGRRNHVLDGSPQVLRDVAMATNFGTKIAITGFVCTIAIRLLIMEGSLSGGPTKCRYCRYTATKGRCYGKHFLSCYICGAHWRHPANTTEPSVCGGDAALFHITLTTCYYSL